MAQRIIQRMARVTEKTVGWATVITKEIKEVNAW